MNTEEAILKLRRDPQWAQRLHDSYLTENVADCAARFASSGEFGEILRMAGGVSGKRVLDVGAGTGIASWAFAKAGAEWVGAIEPDPSPVVGRGALEALVRGLPVECLDAAGESLPQPDAGVDLVYMRQVLHHVADLSAVMRECRRVLKPGGLLLACREHVADDRRQLEAFLASHPVHQLAGGESAYPLAAYVGAMRGAGLEVEAVLGPWDSVINAFPGFATQEELVAYPGKRLEARLGSLGRLLAKVPLARALVKRHLDRPTPGRLYTFAARKPR